MHTKIVEIDGRNATQATADTKIAVIFAVEGHPHNWELQVSPNQTASEFVAAAGNLSGISGVTEVFIEDCDAPLVGNNPLLDQLPPEFVVLHVGTNAAITATFHFNNQSIQHQFQPSATIRTLTIWVISSNGFNLEGSDSDFQLKHDGVVLETGQHLGQVAKGHKEIELDLVFKIKAQG